MGSSTMYVNVTMVPDKAITAWAKQMGYWQVLPSQLMFCACWWYGSDLAWLGFIVYGNSFGCKMATLMGVILCHSIWVFFKSNRITGDLVRELNAGSYTALSPRTT